MPEPTPTIEVRCSQLPILEKCRGLIGGDPEALRIDEDSDIAAEGRALHEMASDYVRTGTMPEGETDAERLYLLHGIASAWEEVKAEFPNPITERALSSQTPRCVFTGHPDVYSVDTRDIAVLDWKSGHNAEASVLPQMIGYAHLIFSQDKRRHSGTCHIRVVWLRERTIQRWDFNYRDIWEMMREMHRHIWEWDGKDYTVGPHCQYCPRFYACPARREIVRAAADELAGMDFEAMTRAEMGPRVIDLYERVKMLERQTDNFRKWLRADIGANGPLTGDGRQIFLSTTHGAAIDPQAAWPILSQHLSDEELAATVKIGKKKLLDAVAAKIARGKKRKARQSLMRVLEKAGALRGTTRQSLATRNVPKELTHDGSTDADARVPEAG